MARFGCYAFHMTLTVRASRKGKQCSEQLGLDLRSATQRRNWGGRRKNSGRKPKNGHKAGVSHGGRPALLSRYPVHVTLKVKEDLPNLRSPEVYRAIEGAFFAAQGRAASGEGSKRFRVVHFCVQ